MKQYIENGLTIHVAPTETGYQGTIKVEMVGGFTKQVQGNFKSTQPDGTPQTIASVCKNLVAALFVGPEMATMKESAAKVGAEIHKAAEAKQESQPTTEVPEQTTPPDQTQIETVPSRQSKAKAAAKKQTAEQPATDEEPANGF